MSNTSINFSMYKSIKSNDELVEHPKEGEEEQEKIDAVKEESEYECDSLEGKEDAEDRENESEITKKEGK